MSRDAKYISLYYSLVHQGTSDFYKEIIKGPGGNMSYLPPWAPASGGGHYPPHMLPPPTTTPSHTTTTQQSHNTPSVYQTLSPVVKSTSVSVTQSTTAPKTSTLPLTASPSPTTTNSSSSSSGGSSISLGDPYEPQGFQRPSTPPHKRPSLGSSSGGGGGGGGGSGEKSESEGGSGGSLSDPPPEMLLALAGPSSMDFKNPRNIPFRSPGKYPAPEQLPNPVMFSYQGRGRPRKNWTHATGLPTMIPVTHPSMHSSLDDGDDEENKPFKCNLCGKGFKLKGGLVQHERTHSTDRPYVCPECGKLFRQPTHLQQHVRIHTGDKPYDCAFCGKAFRQRTILNQHLRIHTGEKPYVCMECGKQFRQKAILDQHFRTHLGEKPYACPHPSCRKHFREMASLISHMKCHKDVPDPRIVLQQAKRMIKEERHDDIVRLDSQGGMDEGVGGAGGGLGGQDRIGPDRGGMAESLGAPNRLGTPERGLGMGPDILGGGQGRTSHGQDHREASGSGGGSGADAPRGYQGNGEPPVPHEGGRPFSQHSSSGSGVPNTSSGGAAGKSSGGATGHLQQQQQHGASSERQSEAPQPPPQPPQAAPSSLSPNMMATPQMAMNLIPYPHSIFPAATYMMPPDPRQYHPQSQAQHPPSRPNQ